jgi:hypothetical protein
MKHVFQRTGNDCGIAVLAMILDEPYDAVLGAVPLDTDGINEVPYCAYLRARGYTLEQRSRAPLGPYPDFPPAPFAPRHFAMVNVNYRFPDWWWTDDAARARYTAQAQAQNIAIPPFHLVALDARGVVFDPTPADVGRRSLHEYMDVLRVVGVWRPDEASGRRDASSC